MQEVEGGVNPVLPAFVRRCKDALSPSAPCGRHLKTRDQSISPNIQLGGEVWSKCLANMQPLSTQIESQATALPSVYQDSWIEPTMGPMSLQQDADKWLREHERRTAICGYIEKTSGVATLLDIQRTTKYHHSQEGEEFLAHFLNSPSVKRALRVDEEAEWVSCRRKVRAIMA